MAAILVFLPQIIAAGEKLWGLVTAIRSAAQQTNEWTADHEQQFQDELLKRGQAPESQPDAK